MERPKRSSFASICTLAEVPRRPEPKIEAVMAAVAAVCHVPRDMIRSERRFGEYMRARMVFYYCARRFTKRSLPQIGRACGGRDHGTIHSGIKTVMRDFGAYAADIAAVEFALFGQGGLWATCAQPVDNEYNSATKSMRSAG